MTDGPPTGRLQLYLDHGSLESFQAAHLQRHDHPARRHDLELIHTTIKNELVKRKTQGYDSASRADAYQWRRTEALVESGPAYLRHVWPYTYQSEPYRTLSQGPVVLPGPEPLPAPATLLTYDQVASSSTRWPRTAAWIKREADPTQLQCLEHAVSHQRCKDQCRGRWVSPGYTVEQLNRLEASKQAKIEQTRVKRLRGADPVVH